MTRPTPESAIDVTSVPSPRFPSRSDGVLRWSEWALIVMLFFVVAGTAPPGVNEAHYLTKAKHYWNPDWCRGDQFLESADAHLAFYWTVGWLTRWWNLSQVAWCGRLGAWCLLAGGWCALGRALALRPGWSLLTAALAVSGWHFAHLSGEWVVGGVEGKVFAYALVLYGLASLAQGGWRAVWWWFGAASALHVLVGGWSVIAAAAVWLVTSRTRRPTLVQLAPHLAGGFGLALVGLVPTLALTWKVPPEVVDQAAQIYVWVRLPHHLLPHHFRSGDIARHLALLTSWAALLWWSYARLNRENRQVQMFVAAAMGIAVLGIAIHSCLVFRPAWMAGLLRFYWFRLSDAMLPVGVSMAVAAALQSRARRSADAGLAVLLLLVAVAISHIFLAQRADRRPLAEGRRVPRAEVARSWSKYSDWREVCQWFQQSTQPDAIVLTPPFLQTFKWHAGRAEVYNWKHIPQDAVGIGEWSRRRDEIDATHLYDRRGPFDREALRAVMDRYQASYLVVDRRRRDVRLGWPLFRNASYAVYHAEPSDTAQMDRPINKSSHESWTARNRQ